MGEPAQVVLLLSPITFPCLKKELTLCQIKLLLISHFWESANKSVEMAVPEDEVDGFLSPKQEREWEEAKKGKACLPKFALPQPFDGTMKDTKSFVSSLILYIYGKKAEFPSNESKIMFVLSYMQGGKVHYWKNEAINLIAAGQEPFKDFKDFIVQMEAQFGDLKARLNPALFKSIYWLPVMPETIKEW